MKLPSTRHPARQFLAFAIAILLTAVCCRAVGRDLFAEGDPDGGLWLTQVAPDVTIEGGPLVSVIRYRGPRDAEWTEAGRISGRAIGTAVVGTQLAVLQESGDWLLVWQSGSISGSPLPNSTPIKALGSDGQTLWAIGIVTGELKPRPTTTQASTQPSTQPTTQSVETGPVPVEAAAVVTEPRAMLFRLSRDEWVPVGRIDAPLDSEFAVLGARGLVIVAARSAGGSIRLFDQDHKRDDIPIGDAATFKLLTHEGELLVWTAKAVGGGEIQRRGKSPAPVALTAAAPAIEADRALAIAAGRLRMMYLAREANSKPDSAPVVYEQKYDITTFQPVGEPAVQQFPMPEFDSTVLLIIRAVAMAGMVIAMVISYQHRKAVRELLEQKDRPMPAALHRRAAAGVIDMIPMAAFAYLGYALFVNHSNPALSFEVGLGAGTVGYLLYTTLCELLIGKTVGKMVLGLKVVSLDGTAPKPTMIVRRNLLRIIDVFSPMLLLVIVSPLRQRVGDIAAGTLVISDTPPANEEPRTK